MRSPMAHCLTRQQLFSASSRLLTSVTLSDQDYTVPLQIAVTHELDSPPPKTQTHRLKFGKKCSVSLRLCSTCRVTPAALWCNVASPPFGITFLVTAAEQINTINELNEIEIKQIDQLKSHLNPI